MDTNNVSGTGNDNSVHELTAEALMQEHRLQGQIQAASTLQHEQTGPPNLHDAHVDGTEIYTNEEDPAEEDDEEEIPGSIFDHFSDEGSPSTSRSRGDGTPTQAKDDRIQQIQTTLDSILSDAPSGRLLRRLKKLPAADIDNLLESLATVVQHSSPQSSSPSNVPSKAGKTSRRSSLGGDQLEETTTPLSSKNSSSASTTEGASQAPVALTSSLSSSQPRKLVGVPPKNDSSLNPSSALRETMAHVQRSAQHLDQARLSWKHPPRRLLVIKKPHDHDVLNKFKQLVRHMLKNHADVAVFFHPDMFKQDLASLRNDQDFAPTLKRLHTWRASENSGAMLDDLSFDLVICLGGDGTLLHAASLFQRQVPPIVSFGLGSLGFLTPFDFTNFDTTIEGVLQGGQQITLRMRLRCEVVVGARNKSRSPSPAFRRVSGQTIGAGPIVHQLSRQKPPSSSHASDTGSFDSASDSDPPSRRESALSNASDWTPLPRTASASRSTTGDSSSVDSIARQPQAGPVAPAQSRASYHVLNELVIDRGPSAFISNLDVFVDGSFVTCVQGDGLIVATPTGSTAYSVASGGSIIHPNVPCILLTPVCPHSLSFRPIIVPATSVIEVHVPRTSRKAAWASFDGHDRQKIDRGSYVRITCSPWPVPTINYTDQSRDWFSSLARCLGWNVRERQRAFQPSK